VLTTIRKLKNGWIIPFLNLFSFVLSRNIPISVRENVSLTIYKVTLIDFNVDLKKNRETFSGNIFFVMN